MRVRTISPIALLIPVVLLATACGGPDLPEHFGIHLVSGGELVRLEMGEFPAAVGGATEIGSIHARADLVGAPDAEDVPPTLFVYLDNVSALDLRFVRVEVGNPRVIPFNPLIAPVDDHDHMYRVDLRPEDSTRGTYEIRLPGGGVCAFRITK